MGWLKPEAGCSMDGLEQDAPATGKSETISRRFISDPRSAILHDSRAFVSIRGLKISARVGAAGPHRPTGKRDKTSRSKIQEKKPDLHLSFDAPHNP
jgi:hypothetical protein